MVYPAASEIPAVTMFAEAPINEPLPPIAEPTDRQKNNALPSAPGTVAVRNAITGNIAAVKGMLAMMVERIALNYDQVQHYELPPNPTKRADTRAEKYIAEYGNECWELDAIEPVELQTMVSEAIQNHIDFDIWTQTWEEILQEKEELRTVFSSIKNLLIEYEYYVPPDSLS